MVRPSTDARGWSGVTNGPGYQMLMRDSLNDDGSLPSPGYPYYSPDVICSKQVTNPQNYFTTDASWNSDPNIPLDPDDLYNYFYVRASNKTSNTLSGWAIRLYWVASSLFMQPSQWTTQTVQTASGKSWVTLPNAAPNGGRVVGNDVFVLSGSVSTGHICLIGVATTTPATPPVPTTDFQTYDAYVYWVRWNQNICGRNLQKLIDYPQINYERLDNFSVPSGETKRLVTIGVEITGYELLPSGTTFGVVCEPLGINTTWDASAGSCAAAAYGSPGLKGYVKTWCTLPTKTSVWPAGVTINTTPYYATTRNAPNAHLASEWTALPFGRELLPDLPEDGLLIALTNCAVEFDTASSAQAAA